MNFKSVALILALALVANTKTVDEMTECMTELRKTGSGKAFEDKKKTYQDETTGETLDGKHAALGALRYCEDLAEVAMDGWNPDASDACRAISEYNAKDSDAKFKGTDTWSEEHGANWHGCMNEALSSIDGFEDDCKEIITYYEDQIACGSNIIGFAAVALLALVF